jgi:hypothetical protein
MSKQIAQEIMQLLADGYERRPSETRRIAKARLIASIAEGLGRAQIATMGAGLSDGSRAAFLDARLSPEERHRVVSALSRDPGDRAEMSSAATLLDCVDAEPSALPRDLLARAATTFVQSAADQASAIGSRRAWRRPALLAFASNPAWRRPALLAFASSLAALILLMAVVPGLLSPAGNKTPTPFAEPTGSARLAAQSAATGSEPGAAIVLPPEPIERARLISARGETSVVLCDDAYEVAVHDYGASEVGKAKDRAALPSGATPETSCGSQSPTADTHSTKPQPRSDGPSLSLRAIPDGLFEVAGRAVSLFGQLGKKTFDLVDPRCIVSQHQVDASRSRGPSSHKNSSKSLWCANHFPIAFPVAQSRVANKDRIQ